MSMNEPPRGKPLLHTAPPEWTVMEARSAFLEANGFTLASYEEAWTKFTLFGITLGVPNTRRHRWAIMLHDLHHVATGFRTDITGEGQISAWELRAGLRHLGLYVGSIVLFGALVGMICAPRLSWRAWKAGGRSLFAGGGPPTEELLSLTVGELRERLGLPAGGLAEGTPALPPRGSTRAA
jgi:hypothetical protein